jgi:Rnl2 family RNA ligase
MTFKKYTSLTNHYHESVIVKWIAHHPEMIDMEFVIQEKIHGANIQLDFDENGEMKVGRRTGYLYTGEKFFDIWKVLDGMKDDIEDLRDEAISNGPIKLYGELFGGNVQKGVEYGPEKRILFYDVFSKGKFFSQENVSYFFKEMVNLPHLLVPTINWTVGIDIALNCNTVFQSKLTPEGFEGANICEGVVIKPWSTVIVDPRDPSSSFMIKKKNQQFLEKQKAPKQAPAATPEELKFLQDEFAKLINEQRVESVYSKHGVIENTKDIGKYVGLTFQDALQEFKIEHGEAFDKLSKRSQKIVTVANRNIGRILMKKL